MTVSLTVARNVRPGCTTTPANASPQPFYSEYAINPREVFRAEVCTINGHQVVRVSRWKRTPEGHKRTGCAFEFGAHRCQGVVNMLSDLARELGGLSHAAT